MIVYERHARDRMGERNVTEADVRLTLSDPHRVRPAVVRPPNPPCTIYEREIRGKVCKVYVRTRTTPPVVATAMWRSE